MCDILIFNSDSYFFLKISLPKIQPLVLNLFFIILSTIFIVPFLSFVFCFIILATEMTFKSIENASIVQIKDHFSDFFCCLMSVPFSVFAQKSMEFCISLRCNCRKTVCGVTLVLTLTYIHSFISAQEEAINSTGIF